MDKETEENLDEICVGIGMSWWTHFVERTVLQASKLIGKIALDDDVPRWQIPTVFKHLGNRSLLLKLPIGFKAKAQLSLLCSLLAYTAFYPPTRDRGEPLDDDPDLFVQIAHQVNHLFAVNMEAGLKKCINKYLYAAQVHDPSMTYDKLNYYFSIFLLEKHFNLPEGYGSLLGQVHRNLGH